MKVILIGRPAARARLRASLAGRGLEVVGEAPTVAAGMVLGGDALLVAVDDSAEQPDEGVALLETLTPREIEVLELLAEGLPNRAIAGRLGISDQTVKSHVAAVCGKLGAANRTEAVRLAVRRGLIPL